VYAGLARQVVAKLARKRPSPLQSGRAATWAGGVVWALGQINFLSDRSTEPYVAHDDLAAAFGLSKSTLGQKAKQIRDTLKITWATPEFLRAERIAEGQRSAAVHQPLRTCRAITMRWTWLVPS
jgi:Domain of unknown function (DUF6398)